MNDLLNFFGPWVQWYKNLRSEGHRKRLKRGEYGNAAIYREWRLLQEQINDNHSGRFGRVYFKVGK